jgi:opacity protein-like surface antigen
MKKIALLVACIAMACSAAFAEGNISYGAKVGANLTNLVGSGAKGLHDMKAGYQFGLFAEFQVAPSVAIAPEVVFSDQGYSLKPATGDRIYDYSNYINVPVMAKFYVAKDFSIDFGPQIGFMVYNKLDGINFKDESNTIDFGLGLGASYNLSENAFIQARYNYGLTHVYKDTKDANGNGEIQLSFGYRF